MSEFELPQTAEKRMEELNKHVEMYIAEYKEFKEKGKKAAGSRSKKALTIVKKLIVSVRRDIQDEIDSFKKTKDSSVSESTATEPEEKDDDEKDDSSES
jgi:hypothetical protein